MRNVTSILSNFLQLTVYANNVLIQKKKIIYLFWYLNKYFIFLTLFLICRIWEIKNLFSVFLFFIFLFLLLLIIFFLFLFVRHATLFILIWEFFYYFFYYLTIKLYTKNETSNSKQNQDKNCANTTHCYQKKKKKECDRTHVYTVDETLFEKLFDRLHDLEVSGELNPADLGWLLLKLLRS